MSITLLNTPTQQQGLKELGNSAPSIKEDLETRLDTPVLDDNTNTWATWLDSKTIQLYGGINEDKRHRFKIDHEFDLSLIINATISPDGDGSTPIKEKIYSSSQGTEFILINKNELRGADNYAISSKKYDVVRAALNAARGSGQAFSVEELVKAGGFKVNEDLAVGEHIKLKGGRDILELKKEDIDKLLLSDFEYIHGGWHSHFIGVNDPATEQELEGAKLYVRYVQEAVKNNCFTNNRKGMGFYVETNVKNYRSRPWFVSGSNSRSSADNRYTYYHSGRFLRVRDGIAAQRRGDAIKIDPAFTQAYNDMVKGANVLQLPNGIYYVRTHGPVNG